MEKDFIYWLLLDTRAHLIFWSTRYVDFQCKCILLFLLLLSTLHSSKVWATLNKENHFIDYALLSSIVHSLLYWKYPWIRPCLGCAFQRRDLLDISLQCVVHKFLIPHKHLSVANRFWWNIPKCWLFFLGRICRFLWFLALSSCQVVTLVSRLCHLQKNL